MSKAHAHPTPHNWSDAARLREVLSSVADELEHARTLGLRVEGAICAMAVQATVDGAIVGELQQLDAIIQHIAALRDFTAALAQNCDAEQVVAVRSALDRITLGEVRKRLSGGNEQEDEDECWEML
jgi:hypothetical protein